MATRLEGSTGVDPRRGNWIRTASGGRFCLLDPDPADVRIADIAHALSQLCRFTGHTRHFYSVAEHCVHVSEIVEREHGLWGLLHNAPEAYIGDVSRPLKHAPGMEGYGEIELEVEAAVCAAFNVDVRAETQQAVKEADLMMLCVEARDLMGVRDFGAAGWRYWTEPRQDLHAWGWSPGMAEAVFLHRFLQLAGEARS